MRRVVAALAATIVGVAFLIAYKTPAQRHDPRSPSAVAGGAPVHAIVIRNFMYSPALVTVTAGSTVSITNTDGAVHTVTSSGAPSAFDTKDLRQGVPVTLVVPSRAGDYQFVCSYHPYMTGTLRVVPS